jgi:hypothetical protein
MTETPATTPRGLGGIATLLLVAALAAGCSSGDSTDSDAQPTFPDESFTVIANADIGTGPTRLLIGVVAEDGTRLGSPDHPIQVEAALLDDPDRSQQVPAEYAWIIEDAIGLYRAEFDFDQAGTWAITVTPERGGPLPPAPITVLEETHAPSVGEAAPDAPTPTLRDHSIEDLTTDRQPDARFYQMTLGEALDSGRPTVLVFSTPAYCLTATCGPLLDTVKELAPGYPGVNFIHIEVYTGLNEPGFAPDPAHLAPAAGPTYWNLPSEPWVFVIDETGTVTARFEGAVTSGELASALN